MIRRDGPGGKARRRSPERRMIGRSSRPRGGAACARREWDSACSEAAVRFGVWRGAIQSALVQRGSEAASEGEDQMQRGPSLQRSKRCERNGVTARNRRKRHVCGAANLKIVVRCRLVVVHLLSSKDQAL